MEKLTIWFKDKEQQRIAKLMISKGLSELIWQTTSNELTDKLNNLSISEIQICRNIIKSIDTGHSVF